MTPPRSVLDSPVVLAVAVLLTLFSLLVVASTIPELVGLLVKGAGK